MRQITLFLIIAILSSASFISFAQEDLKLLKAIAEEEKESVNALVLYPKDTRLAILEAAIYPEALIKLEQVQTSTSASFRELMEVHPRNIQEKAWDLTRYPGLISRLTSGGKKSRNEIDNILLDYPQSVHDNARELTVYQFELLEEIEEMNQTSGAIFESVLEPYPPKTQEALRELVLLPEVLSILTEDIRLTILVGDLYKKKPEWVIQKADSVSMVVARENAQEVEEWKQSLEENPEAAADFEQSARAFASEYNYDDVYYDEEEEDDDLYYYEEEVEEKTIVEHHYYHHYPYWYGYPYWYDFPRWRPYPVWYDWGFYYGRGGSIIVLGLPSFSYMHWYFYHPHHHYYFSHLSCHFVNHYYGHRTMGSSITVSVNNWRTSNRDVVTEDWLATSRTSPRQFREYGQFESARIKHNKEHPSKTLTPREYLKSHETKYPRLSGEVKKQPDIAPAPDKKTADKPVIRDKKTEQKKQPQPDIKGKQPPAIKKPKTERKKYPTTTTPKPTPKTKTRVYKQKDVSKEKYPNINKARQYHKSQWNQKKTTRKPTMSTSPKTTKRKSPVIKKPTTTRKKTKSGKN